MQSESTEPVTKWIGDLKTAGNSAAQHLWERYFEKLVTLARARLGNARRLTAAADEEDFAASAFGEFCRRAAEGRFPNVANRDELWRLLVCMTMNKARQHIRRELTGKRRRDRQVELTDEIFDNLIGHEPTPEVIAILIEEYQRVNDSLGDEISRLILNMNLEGYTHQEIADRVGRQVKTVSRKLVIIRKIMRKEIDEG